MDFTFSQDQRTFRDAMCNYLMVETNTDLHRELWETSTGRSAEVWNKFAHQGLTSLSVPESAGGLGCGDLDWALMAQDLGYYGVADSITDTAWIAAALLKKLPDGHALRGGWLPRIADGSARIAIGHPINPLVADAHVANLMLLNHEAELHAVDPAAVKLTANESVDPSRRLFRVDWKPTKRTRVCDARQAAELWQGVLERGALSAAVQMLGLAQRMLDLAIDYSAQRKQFGKPIGSFQAVKHLLADVAVKLEFARPVAFSAAYALDRGDPRVPPLVSHAKVAATEVSWLAAKNCMQVHGAMGYTWELDLQMFMKRAWALAGAWGDRGFHKARVADFVFSPEARLGPGSTFID